MDAIWICKEQYCPCSPHAQRILDPNWHTYVEKASIYYERKENNLIVASILLINGATIFTQKNILGYGCFNTYHFIDNGYMRSFYT